MASGQTELTQVSTMTGASVYPSPVALCNLVAWLSNLIPLRTTLKVCVEMKLHHPPAGEGIKSIVPLAAFHQLEILCFRIVANLL